MDRRDADNHRIDWWILTSNRPLQFGQSVLSDKKNQLNVPSGY
jgi:hypothetical protein